MHGTKTQSFSAAAPPSATDRPWHAMDVAEVQDQMGGVGEGLTQAEAQERWQRYGANRLPASPRRSAFQRFFIQFHHLLIYVLLGAALITALLQHWLDTAVILSVVLVNAVIGFFQEGKAEQALDALSDLLSPQASILRDGLRQTVPAEALVPGDWVLLEAGDRVPADLRLLHVKGLQVQEGALTGESVPVNKHVDPVPVHSDLGDRACMVYSGTLVTRGRGTGLVVATGAATQIGHISQLMAQVETLTTPLLQAMAVFARWLTLAILFFAALIFLFGFLVRDLGAIDSFLAAVALAVAAIPEGLPTILTITLAIGVQRMAVRNAIIRRLPAVETLGSVSIICSDKTGTLTRNEMTVRSVALAEADYTLSGVGYDPHGEFARVRAPPPATVEWEPVDPEAEPLLQEVLWAMVLCNDAQVREETPGQWSIQGDPMEAALLVAGRKAGLDPGFEQQAWTRTDVIPFESEHGFMATLHHDHQGHGAIVVKGAPERLLTMCSRVRTTDGEQPLETESWLQRIDALASQGERVLAVAYRPTLHPQTDLLFADASDLILLGLCGLIDPPREEAITAVADCQRAGIRVKMITGDHAGTARAIGRQLGLKQTDTVLTGRAMDDLDANALRVASTQVDIFARTTPEHKLRLVQALQAQGFVVAMTGDGVNDAPALKQADVGVAMGQKGTETAKEAAEMVLTDDHFVSIVHAVREGRTVYDNLKKAITFLLPINGGEAGSIVVAILFGWSLPITPLQILWVNMVSSVALAMALAFEPAEPDLLRRPPRPPGTPILSAFVLWRILLVSCLFLSGIFGMYAWSLAQGFDEALARTHAVNTLVIMEVFYLLSVRSLKTREWSLQGWLGTRAVWLAVTVVLFLQGLFTYAPFMQMFFASRPVAWTEAILIVGVGLAIFLILEGEKWLLRALRPAHPAKRS
jgi:magnesium-transporting ATPase (P-type)